MEGVEITKEPDSSGNATLEDDEIAEAPTMSSKDKAEEKEEEPSSEEEHVDEWARKVEEAKKLLSVWPQANN